MVGSPGTAWMTGLIRIYKHLGVISCEGQRIDFLLPEGGGLCLLMVVLKKQTEEFEKN